MNNILYIHHLQKKKKKNESQSITNNFEIINNFEKKHFSFQSRINHPIYISHLCKVISYTYKKNNNNKFSQSVSHPPYLLHKS